MNLASILSVLVVSVAVPMNWLVTIRLWRLSRGKPRIGVLRERAFVSLALTIIVTIFALIFLNNDLPVPVLDGATTKIITRAAVLVWSVIPAAYWLWLYRKSST